MNIHVRTSIRGMAGSSSSSPSSQERISALAALSAHLKKATYHQLLSSLNDVESFPKDCYPSFDTRRTQTISESGDSEIQWVIVCTPKFHACGDSGPIQAARVVFNSAGTYAFQVLFVNMKTGTWKDTTNHDELTSTLDMLLSNSGYLLCPGICNYGVIFGQHIRFKPKNLRVWNVPQSRTDSVDCKLWHKPVHVNQKVDSPTYDMCASCRLLNHDLRVIRNRAITASPTHKEKQTAPDSNRPLKYLSPGSQAMRLQKSTKERKHLRKALFKAERAMDIALTEEQENEIS